MKWVEFKSTVQFESLGRNKGPTFDAGSRHELESDFADRWIRRGVAVAVEGPLVVNATEAPPPGGSGSQESAPTSEVIIEEPKAGSKRSKASAAQS